MLHLVVFCELQSDFVFALRTEEADVYVDWGDLHALMKKRALHFSLYSLWKHSLADKSLVISWSEVFETRLLLLDTVW